MNTIDERIAKLENLLYTDCPGTQITRVLSGGEGGGFRWCVAVGVLNAPKLFFYGDSVEDALASAERELLTPWVPDVKTLRMLAKRPGTPIYRGPGILAVLNLEGINLADYLPIPRRKAVAA